MSVAVKSGRPASLRKEPVTDPAQELAFGWFERAVRLRADVEEQCAVLAHDIHQIAQDHPNVLVLLAFDPTPRMHCDGGVVLPQHRPDARVLSALDVVDG